MASNSKRPKMPVSERAKQFMPFAALSGLPEALRKVEEEMSIAETGYDDDYGAWRETDRRQYGRREEIRRTN